MLKPVIRKIVTTSSIALLTLSLASCSAQSGGADTAVPTDNGAPADGAGESANQDRAFDSTDDAVITAIEAALKSDNASAQWNDKMLVVTLDGSIDEPTAWLPCGAATAVIADTETAKFIYDDGELLCSERPGYGDND